MIISLYAGGMTVRDIQHHLSSPLGVDISPDTINTITDAVLDEVMVWQNRQMDEYYPHGIPRCAAGPSPTVGINLHHQRLKNG